MSYSSKQLRQLIAGHEAALRQPGAVLFSQARYEIERVLGEGGMGITCLAREISDANMRRPVVLKFVKDSLDPQRLAQFLNEVQLSILFNHPNLVPMYRLETEIVSVEAETLDSADKRRRPHRHTVYYAAMQYIDGWNLRQIVDRLKNLKILLNHDITLFISGRVARGLHYVHEYCDGAGNHLGLVHRDVSPENILIDHFARIKVADFGIARAMKRDRLGPTRAGNPLYCSPEQLDGAKLDRRSDIYNVGLIMYFLFTNTDRFGPESGSDRPRERIRTKMTKSPCEDLRRIHAQLIAICERCLQENPDDRYGTCEDLANDIDMYFKERQRVPTNEQLDEILNDAFSSDPKFVSPRFIPLTGSPVLEQPGYDPGQVSRRAEPASRIRTVRLEDTDS